MRTSIPIRLRYLTEKVNRRAAYNSLGQLHIRHRNRRLLQCMTQLRLHYRSIRKKLKKKATFWEASGEFVWRDLVKLILQTHARHRTPAVDRNSCLDPISLHQVIAY